RSLYACLGSRGRVAVTVSRMSLQGWRHDRARVLIDGEVVQGEPAGHGRAQRPGLDDGVVRGRPVGGVALPAAVGRIPVNLQAIGLSLGTGVVRFRFRLGLRSWFRMGSRSR